MKYTLNLTFVYFQLLSHLQYVLPMSHWCIKYLKLCETIQMSFSFIHIIFYGEFFPIEIFSIIWNLKDKSGQWTLKIIIALGWYENMELNRLVILWQLKCNFLFLKANIKSLESYWGIKTYWYQCKPKIIQKEINIY